MLGEGRIQPALGVLRAQQKVLERAAAATPGVVDARGDKADPVAMGTRPSPGTAAELRAKMDAALAKMHPAVAKILAAMPPELFDKFERFERVDSQVLDGALLARARERLGPLYIGATDFQSFEELEAAVTALAGAIATAKADKTAPTETDADMVPQPIEERLLARLQARERLTAPVYIGVGS
jgi:hypothetical protein